jgi:hypothetical protein
MFNRREPLDGAAADTLRRRVGADERWMLGFETLQLPHQRIEFGVGDLGRCVNVVKLLVATDLVTQALNAVRYAHSGRVNAMDTKVTMDTKDKA